MALKDILERQWGVKTDQKFNPMAASVATTVTQLLEPNPNRLAWVLCNLGANVIYLAFTPDVSTTKGIYIAKNGGTLTMIWNEDFELVSYPVWGIADTAACDIYMVEVVEL